MSGLFGIKWRWAALLLLLPIDFTLPSKANFSSWRLATPAATLYGNTGWGTIGFTFWNISPTEYLGVAHGYSTLSLYCLKTWFTVDT